MSIFYEGDLLQTQREKTFPRKRIAPHLIHANKRRGKMNEVYARYNNGNQKPTPSMVMTIPAFIVRKMGLKSGDKILLIEEDPEDNPKGEIIFKFKKALE